MEGSMKRKNYLILFLLLLALPLLIAGTCNKTIPGVQPGVTMSDQESDWPSIYSEPLRVNVQAIHLKLLEALWQGHEKSRCHHLQ